MTEFLNAILSFPTAIFTVLVGFVLLFWTTVVIGGADPNSLDGDADLHADGDVHTDGDVSHGDADGHGHDGDAEHSGGSAILNFMNVGSVPLSVIVSAVSLFGWVASATLQMQAGPWLASMMPAAAAGTAIFGAATLGSFVLAGLTTRPLRGAFRIQSKHAEESIVDHICTIQTTKVTAEFGQALYETGGAPLNLSVRCTQQNGLTKGAKAVIIGYDAKTNTYEVGELGPDFFKDSGEAAKDNGKNDEKDASQRRKVSDALKKARG